MAQMNSDTLLDVMQTEHEDNCTNTNPPNWKSYGTPPLEMFCRYELRE